MIAAMRMPGRLVLLAGALCALWAAGAQARAPGREAFDALDLDRPGLEAVKREVEAERYDAAAQALLDYFRAKHAGRAPDYSNAEQPPAARPDAATLEAADNALAHRFRPQKGYGYFDYGRDIDWQRWPVKDNEVRWQLHRVGWWSAMAQVYRATREERYAREWMAQFRDWMQKNPLGLSADNDRYAWRPLEVSDRVQSLVPTFASFVGSPSMTPEFLMQFLDGYRQQAQYLPGNYADKGNHRLFEAQRLLFAGASFPEFRQARAWRKSGIEVLSEEIRKQVYPDGVQFELSPVYHVASIDIFLKAYQTAAGVGAQDEFPPDYRRIVESMILAYADFSFPDYNAPMFGDSWLVARSERIKRYQSWMAAFPQNPAIRYFATQGREGRPPAHLSRGLTSGGFYTFRNGWRDPATVLILKASPPGEFHAQPDNGTFELWVDGRNFTPDSGAFVYSGDAQITRMREWYRHSRVHSTLTLDDADMRITQARLLQWDASSDPQVLSYVNPSYDGLDHQRTVLFVERKYFLIVDRAVGAARGTLGAHFVLREDSAPAFAADGASAHTRYADGNNLLVKNLDADGTRLRREDGKVSYAYRKETARPAFVFEKAKTDAAPRTFVTVLFPYRGSAPPSVRMRANAGNDFDRGRLDLSLVVDGKERRVRASTRANAAPAPGAERPAGPKPAPAAAGRPQWTPTASPGTRAYALPVSAWTIRRPGLAS